MLQDRKHHYYGKNWKKTFENIFMPYLSFVASEVAGNIQYICLFICLQYTVRGNSTTPPSSVSENDQAGVRGLSEFTFVCVFWQTVANNFVKGIACLQVTKKPAHAPLCPTLSDSNGPLFVYQAGKNDFLDFLKFFQTTAVGKVKT